jgi:preprotein translocase subunit SecF
VSVTTTAPGPGRRGLFGTLRDIYHERTSFDFVGKSRWWALLSGGAIVISVAALALSGLNLGIDFEGGNQWEVNVTGRAANIDDVRDALAGTQAADAKVLVLTGTGGDAVRIQTDELTAAQRDAVTTAVADYGGVEQSEVSFVEVGPTWGEQVTRKAVIALGVFFLLIAAYLSFRFEWRMALAALVAVVHDIIITAGVYAITGFEVTPATVVAFLTILGFSLYDTVVVFDKVKENTPSLGADRGDTYGTMVNRSMNEVLMRSINTSFVALLPVASLLVVGSGFLGAVTLRDFALALFVGLLVGAYSSIFVATPVLAWLKEREPRYAALRERARVQRAKGAPVPAPAVVSGGPPTGGVGRRDDLDASPIPGPDVPTGDASADDASAGESPRTSSGITPRARRQRGRKRR